MNLKGFKKVHEDDHKAVLKNQHGHSITIAKSALQKGHLESLKKLPLHADQGAVVPPIDYPDQKSKNVPVFTMPDVVARGEMATPDPTTNRALYSGNEAARGELDAPTAPGAPSGLGSLNNRVTASDEPTSIEQTETAPGGKTGGVSDPTDEALAQQTQAPVQPQPDPSGPPPQQQVQAMKQQYMKKPIQEASAWANDLANGHITPETYQGLFAKKDTLGKVGTLFGMMTSGLGSGLSGQPNAVMGMMDKEINNDLEAQKQSKVNAQNYIRLHQEHEFQKAQMEGMSVDNALKRAQLSSQNAALNMMDLGVDQHLQDHVNRLPEGSPQQQQAQGALNLKKANTARNIQGRAQDEADKAIQDPETAWQLQNNKLMTLGTAMGNMAYVQKAKFDEAHHFTGYNQPANREISAVDRNELKTLNNLDQSYTEAQNLIKRNGKLGPKFAGFIQGPEYDRANALEGRLQTELGKLSGVNRFSQGLQSLHQKRMPDLVGSHLTNQDLNKVKDLQNEVREARASIFGSYGIGAQTAPQSSESKRAAAEKWLKANPNSPHADDVKRILGKP